MVVWYIVVVSCLVLVSTEDVSECAARQAAYYRTHHKDTNYFYGDLPLDRFKKSMAGKWLHPCGSGGSTAVVDVGANVGQDVAYWAQEFGSGHNCTQSTIHLFEPNPLTAHRLNATVLTMYSNEPFIVYAAAAAKQAGRMHFAPDPFGSGRRRGAQKKGPPRKSFAASSANELGTLLTAEGLRKLRVRPHPLWTVAVVRLDELLRNVTEIPLLKIDAEGHDATVLEGSQGLFSRTRAIQYECSNIWSNAPGARVPGSGHSLKAVVDWLEREGFLSFQVGSPHFMRMWGPYWRDAYTNFRGWSNCFALPKDSPLFRHISVLC